MIFKWNAKADTVSTIVLWFGSLLAVLICGIWLVKNFNPQHLTLQNIDNELTNLQTSLNSACRSSKYWENYYPKTNTGNLIINDLQVCIDSSDCDVIYYQELTEAGSDLILDPCPSIGSCDVLYFQADKISYADKITVHDYVECSDPTALLRCRIMTCNLSIRQYINLDNLTYLRISKNETFTILAE